MNDSHFYSCQWGTCRQHHGINPTVYVSGNRQTVSILSPVIKCVLWSIASHKDPTIMWWKGCYIRIPAWRSAALIKGKLMCVCTEGDLKDFTWLSAFCVNPAQSLKCQDNVIILRRRINQISIKQLGSDEWIVAISPHLQCPGLIANGLFLGSIPKFLPRLL